MGSITLPEDEKKIVDKEIKAVSEKLEVTGRFGAAVAQIEEFVGRLTAFDSSLKTINDWMAKATAELEDIKNALAACSLRIVWPALWICGKTLPPKLRSSRPTQLLSWIFFPRVRRSLRMLRTTRTNSTGS